MAVWLHVVVDLGVGSQPVCYTAVEAVGIDKSKSESGQVQGGETSSISNLQLGAVKIGSMGEKSITRISAPRYSSAMSMHHTSVAHWIDYLLDL